MNKTTKMVVVALVVATFAGWMYFCVRMFQMIAQAVPGITQTLMGQ